MASYDNCVQLRKTKKLGKPSKMGALFLHHVQIQRFHVPVTIVSEN